MKRSKLDEDLNMKQVKWFTFEKENDGKEVSIEKINQDNVGKVHHLTVNKKDLNSIYMYQPMVKLKYNPVGSIQKEVIFPPSPRFGAITLSFGDEGDSKPSMCQCTLQGENTIELTDSFIYWESNKDNSKQSPDNDGM